MAERRLFIVTIILGNLRFDALNLNTDRARLSFGLLQWAQRPGMLGQLLSAIQQQQPAEFTRVFGGGDAELAQRLIEFTTQPSGGVDQMGQTTDPAFDLIREPWSASCFAISAFCSLNNNGRRTESRLVPLLPVSRNTRSVESTSSL